MNANTKYFHWLGVDLRIDTDCSAAEKAVMGLIGQHLVNDPQTRVGPIRCHITKNSDTWQLSWHLGNTMSGLSLAQLLVRIEYDWFMAIQHKHAGRILFFHASALLLNGRAIMVAGGPDSGKTTMALTASLQGHHIIGDELIAVDIESHKLSGLQRGLKLNQSYPGAQELDSQTHLLSAAKLNWADQSWRKLDQIIILDPQARPEIARQDGAPAAQRLYPHCLNSLSFTNGGMRHVIHLTQAVPSAVMGRSAPQQMIQAMAS